MDAKTYNDKRRILFCTAQDQTKGFAVAYEYLEAYKATLGPKGHVGLKAELNFFEKYRNEFKLTVAGDMGEHADFAGVYGKAIARFDVTTNLDFKKFADYQPHLGDGPEYKVVLVNRETFEIADVVSLAFRGCDCGGYFLPVFALLEQNYNESGESNWTNDQLLLDVCSTCKDMRERDRFTHHFLLHPNELTDPDADPEARETSLSDYGLDLYKWLRREYCEELMAVAKHDYEVTDKDGDGFWGYRCLFRNAVVKEALPDVFAS